MGDETMKDKSNSTPREIPTRKDPDKISPEKNPHSPSRQNPINPKEDEIPRKK